MKVKLVLDEKPSCCEECPLRSYSNLALFCTALRKTKEEDDVCPLVEDRDPEDTISIKWLHKELIEAIYKRKLSGDITTVFYEIIAKWDKEHEKSNTDR